MSDDDDDDDNDDDDVFFFTQDVQYNITAMAKDQGVPPRNSTVLVQVNIKAGTTQQPSWGPDPYIPPVRDNISHILFSYSQVYPNGHLPLTAICVMRPMFLSLCSTFPIKTICHKRPSVLYGH
jgi:hypothetical protein